jgi:chemotaxis regulatin CheY-phosphate phosphatase CheZ
MCSKFVAVAQYSIGDALKKMLKESNWRQRYLQSRIRQDYEEIMGKTIARYTQEVKLVETKLVIKTNVGPLKHELNSSKEMIIARFNEHLQETVIKEVIIL